MVTTRSFIAHIALALAAGTGMTGTASAATMVTGSTLNFAGQSQCTSTGCTYGSVIVTSGTGSFSGFTFGTTATFFPVTFSPFTAQQIYTATDSVAETASFAVTAAVTQSSQAFDGLRNFTFTDAGIAQLTGYGATPGYITVTANQNGSLLGSFSSTSDVASAAPEPMIWALLILGFGAIGMAMRRQGRLSRQFRLV